MFVTWKRFYYKGIRAQENDTEVSFLRRSGKLPNNFHMPNVPDITPHVLRWFYQNPNVLVIQRKKNSVCTTLTDCLIVQIKML